MKKNKIAKILAMIFAGTMLLAITSCGGKKVKLGTVPNPESDFEFTLNKDMTEVTITKYKGTRSDLVIPEAIQGVPVTTIGSGKPIYGDYNNREKIKSLVIPASVKKISSKAFSGAKALQLIDIKSCETIDTEAFGGIGYKLLKYKGKDDSISYIEESVEIHFPANLKKIEKKAFASTVIEELNLQNCTELSKIGIGAFSHCDYLKKAVLPEGLKIICANAFNKDVKLAEINFPSTIKVIDQSAFCKSGVKEVKLNEGLEVLGSFAFYGCKELETVTIPESFKYWVSDGYFDHFTDCDKLSQINFPSDTSKWSIIYYNSFTDCFKKAHGYLKSDSFSMEKMFSGAAIKTSIPLQKLIKFEIPTLKDDDKAEELNNWFKDISPESLINGEHVDLN